MKDSSEKLLKEKKNIWLAIKKIALCFVIILSMLILRSLQHRFLFGTFFSDSDVVLYMTIRYHDAFTLIDAQTHYSGELGGITNRELNLKSKKYPEYSVNVDIYPHLLNIDNNYVDIKYYEILSVSVEEIGKQVYGEDTEIKVHLPEAHNNNSDFTSYEKYLSDGYHHDIFIKTCSSQLSKDEDLNLFIRKLSDRSIAFGSIGVSYYDDSSYDESALITNAWVFWDSENNKLKDYEWSYNNDN